MARHPVVVCITEVAVAHACSGGLPAKVEKGATVLGSVRKQEEKMTREDGSEANRWVSLGWRVVTCADSGDVTQPGLDDGRGSLRWSFGPNIGRGRSPKDF
jgi:hypothetical protein